MAGVREVGRNVYSIDDNLYSLAGAGSVYFLAEEKKALIDTGPATSAKSVLEGIQQVGFKPEDVDFIILTHIHLDHSGGAGTLLKKMPQARVIAHRRAIKHLIDPSRLVNSAIQAQGREFVSKNGEVLPIPEQLLIPATDGDTLRLGNGQVLTLFDCPGHAPHELCIFEGCKRGLFAGDAIGHYIDGTDVMVPITPPPSFDLELFIKTIHRILSLDASRIYFAHAGTSTRVAEKLESSIRKLHDRDSVIAKAASEGQLNMAAEILVKHICSELEWVRREMRLVYDYWASVDIPMSAAEHVRYYKKKHGIT